MIFTLSNMKVEKRALIISQFLEGWSFVQLVSYHKMTRTELEQVIREAFVNGVQ